MLKYIMDSYEQQIRDLEIAIESEPEKELSNIKRRERVLVLKQVLKDLGDIDDDQNERRPDPLTDVEQRIFLAAMSKERKICNEMDNEDPPGYKLTPVCWGIERKVKRALF